MNFRKQALVCTTLLLLAHVIPLGITRGYAETNRLVDEQAFANLRNHTPDYLALSAANPSLEEAPPAVQEFSFVEKTFQTVTGQPVILRFTSTYPADEVLVRIPTEGQVLASHFSDGESITHSQGEYWTLRTEGQQTEFTLPVVFETVGNYFLTIDHDADHFYLEVEDGPQRAKTDNQSIQETEKESTQREEEDELQESPQHTDDKFTFSTEVRPIMANEKNLVIPEAAIHAEEARILESTRDSQNRSRKNVRNWSGFRSAWNSGSVTEIMIESTDIKFSSSILGDSLNARSSSVMLSETAFSSLNFDQSSNALAMTGGDLIINISSITTAGSTMTTTPVISHSGSGSVELGPVRVPKIYSYRPNTAVVSLNGSSTLWLRNGWIMNGASSYPLQLNGTSSLIMEGGRLGDIRPIGIGNSIPPISSSANSNIYLKGTNVMIAGRLQAPGPIADTSFAESWYSVDAHITGTNGSTVISSKSDPDDFTDRYLANRIDIRYQSIIVGATTTEGFDPPRPSYELSLQASPIEGGIPTAEDNPIIQGDTTKIHANPDKKFDFVRWEIVSGTGSSIADATNATTIFTMGTADAVIQAVYQKKQGGNITVKYVDSTLKKLAEPEIISGLIDEEYETKAKEIEGYTLTEIPKNASGRFIEEAQTVTYVYTKDDLDPVLPADPLAPEKEVDPENPPELPVDQGALSIDFVSRFYFGKQGISAQTKRYYAQPQRLLNADGSINDAEERPNYIQVSDRRPEEERHGWQLAVTQNNQFTDRQDNQLRGARLLLNNQQFASVQESNEPMLQNQDGIVLIPEEKTLLVTAHDGQGAGTWIYRFGNRESAGESVALEVPPTANPRTATYQTTLTWELSAVPDN